MWGGFMQYIYYLIWGDEEVEEWKNYLKKVREQEVEKYRLARIHHIKYNYLYL